jgi:hypothetical protein
MKFLFPSLLLLTILALFSCQKDDFDEAYLRGGNCIIPANDGNMIIAGFNTGGIGNYDGYLTKVSPEGAVQWGYFYGGIYSDGLYKVIPSTDGGYVATGFVGTYSDSYTNLMILKVNENGEKLWLTTFGGDSIAQGFSVTSSGDGGYIACGFIQNNYGADRDLYLVKVTAGGGLVWQKRYGTPYSSSSASTYDAAYSIAPVGDSSFYITGSLSGQSNCCGNIFLMKINASGDSLWTKTYSQGIGYSVIVASDGNLVIGGAVSSNAQDVYLMKTTLNGDKIWADSTGGKGYDFGTGLIQTSDGGYAIAGITSASGSSDQNVSLTKFDATGSVSWTHTYGGDQIDQGTGVVQQSDGGFSLTGMSNSGGSYIFLNKTDASGTEAWQKNIK